MGEWKPVASLEFFAPDVARQQLVDWLFIKTIEDLRARSELPAIRHYRYEILGIAPLLRKLMIDRGKSLLHLVRRVPGRPGYAFGAEPWQLPEGYNPPAAGGLMAVGGEDLIADASPGLKLDPFLAMRVGHVGGHDISVRQMIRHFANVEGGVHLGRSEEPINDLLQWDAPDQPYLWALPQSWTVLLPLGKIVVAGCEDLLAEVRNQHDARRIDPKPLMLGRPTFFRDPPSGKGGPGLP